MFYLDASLIISSVTKEVATDATLDWLAAHRAEQFTISDWSLVEVASALSIKVRTGELDAEARSKASAAFQRAVAASYSVLPLTREHFRAAENLLQVATLGLRAGDALHVAVARDSGATLVTLDHRLASAGNDLGIRTKLIVHRAG